MAFYPAKLSVFFCTVLHLHQNVVLTGIWADESDEEDARPGFGGRSKKNQDYMSGINFISGGFKKSAEEEEADTKSQASLLLL